MILWCLVHYGFCLWVLTCDVELKGSCDASSVILIEWLFMYKFITCMLRGKTWIMYFCVPVFACAYVCRRTNACNPIYIYFTHAHINLLFIKKVFLFIFRFFLCSFLPALQLLLYFWETLFLLSKTRGHFGAKANLNIFLLCVCVCACV